MAEAGVFAEDDRLELIEGEIVEVPGSDETRSIGRSTTPVETGAWADHIQKKSE